MNSSTMTFIRSFAGIKANFLLAALIILCPHPSKTNAATYYGNNETDWEALNAFRADISGDPFGFLNSWNDSVHFCQWSGVECNRKQRVIALSVPHQKFTGSLSPYIGNMSFLRGLSVANNSLTQEIPPQLGRLQRLEILYLHNNSFSGHIPTNLSYCTNLDTIGLSRNNLQGKIPAELGSLSKLKTLAIAYNQLTGGIPLSFGNLSSLVALDANSNNLAGSIPSVLGKLKKLESIYLSINNISGAIPFGIYNLSSLVQLSVAFNQIHGTLPLDIGTMLPNLNYLNFVTNHLTGSFPISISNLSNLVYFLAEDNQLTGRVPTFHKMHKLYQLDVSVNHLGSGQENDLSFISSLSNATDLTVLTLGYNNFGGSVPESLGYLSTKLVVIELRGNHISGNLPIGIGNLVNLDGLDLSENHFTGNIPPDIWKLQNLRVLNLGTNNFSGKVSPFLGNLSLLLRLHLNKNDFQGAIPSSIGYCNQLLGLDLSENSFNGKIPKELFDLSLLSMWLDLSGNLLSGFLPMEIENLKNLGSLDISNNRLSGEIPISLGICSSMEYLYMGGNSFQGNIPPSFSSLRGIQLLDLSLNNLSGQIPNFLGGLDLQSLNLSFNDFEGELPREGLFKNSSAFSVKGNSRLCGGIPELNLPLCIAKRPKKRRLTLRLRFVIITTLGLLGLTSALGMLLCCWLRKKRKEPPSSSPGYSSLLRMSFQTLLNATDGFASANLIGLGSFGSVYRGVLEDGKAVAVKVLNLQRHGALKSFMAECEALRNIRHRNLVGVLSVCSGVDYQGNDFKAVVYELMVNGSLDEWLHSVPQVEPTPRKCLNLLQRLHIAIDVASAIDYLHHQCQSLIVHCDIKPGNILLDNEMVAHVGDFGLARLVLEETNSLPADQSSSVAIKGTVGYAPPEYGMGSEVSVYGDIYSYGILLLELFTGKRPTDDMFHGNLNLHNFVKLAFSDGLVGIVDPMLLQLGEDGETGTKSCCGKVQECLISILKIGISCSMESQGERMDIKSAAGQLQVIRNSFLGTVGEHGNDRTRSAYQL